MTDFLHRALGRRSLLKTGAALGGSFALSNMVGCRASEDDDAEASQGAIGAGGGDVPTASELASSQDARLRYRETLAKVFGHGIPNNRREMHRLVESLALSNKGIGHFAFTIPGDSLEHIKVATAFWAEEFRVGPFFVIESDASVGQYYYPVDPNTKRRVDETAKQKLEWPAYTALCKPNPDYYIEFNLQTNDTASTYRDMYTSKTGGFHHFAVITPTFAADKAVMDARYQPSSSLITSIGAVYYDARKDVDCMFELLETNKYLDHLFRSTYQLSIRANLDDYTKTFNIAPADTSKPVGQRGLTVTRILDLITWANKEGPLAGQP